MDSRRTTLRFLRFALGVALAFCGAAPALAADVDAAWFPLRDGATSIYDTHRDRTFRPDGAMMNRGLHLGRTTLETKVAPKRPAGEFLVTETTVLKRVEGMGEEELASAWTVYSLGKELRIHASSETRADGSDGEVIYDPPLRILPTTTVGETWNAGTLRNGAQRAKIKGEVLGIEDLDGKPPWPNSLKVRLAGTIDGTVTASDPPVKIESGNYERLLWFVRGVGIVRDVTTVTLDMEMPDERHVKTIDVLTLRLVEQRGTE